MVREGARNIVAESIHNHTRQTLSLSHRTIFVCQEQSFKTNDFFPQLGYLTRKSIILGRKQFNLGLQICKPLLLPLTTFERSNSARSISKSQEQTMSNHGIPVPLQEILSLLLISHLFPVSVMSWLFFITVVLILVRRL